MNVSVRVILILNATERSCTSDDFRKMSNSTIHDVLDVAAVQTYEWKE